MANELATISLNQLDKEFLANILVGAPIAIIDCKNVDRFISHTKLTSLLNELKMELWLWDVDNEGYHCIRQYLWRGEPEKLDPYSFVPDSKFKRINGNKIECVLNEYEVILQYVLPKMGAGKIFAFYTEDIGYWHDFQLKLAEEAYKHNQTVLILTENLYPSECELVQHLELYLKKRIHPEYLKFELKEEDVYRIASLLTDCSSLMEAEEKFKKFVIQHYLKHEHEKEPCVIDNTAIDEFEKEIKGE